MSDLDVLRELYEAKFEAQRAKIEAVAIASEKADDRQDEAIERLAERTTHTAETKRLTERVTKLEGRDDENRNQLNDLRYKVKVTWAVGTAVMGAFISIMTAVIKGWIGV
jgi:hypothetical protein